MTNVKLELCRMEADRGGRSHKCELRLMKVLVSVETWTKEGQFRDKVTSSVCDGFLKKIFYV